MRNNPRVILPPPRPPEEERTLETKEVLREEITHKYIKKNCTEKGEPRFDNLTAQQRRGVKKLNKRQEAGEIVVGITDKSGRLTVSTSESYKVQGDPHVKNDKEITWKEVEEIKKTVGHH